jgi:hypothetical protein
MSNSTHRPEQSGDYVPNVRHVVSELRALNERVLVSANLTGRENEYYQWVSIAIEALERLHGERDEARRMYCRCRMDLDGVPMEELNEEGAAFAASRGWDCFGGYQA